MNLTCKLYRQHQFDGFDLANCGHVSTTNWPSSPTPLTFTDGPLALLQPPSPIIPKKRQRDKVDVRDILEAHENSFHSCSSDR